MTSLAYSDPRSFKIPVISSTLIVLVIVGLFTTQWMVREERIIKPPLHINARLVQVQAPKKKLVTQPKQVKKEVKKTEVKKSSKPVKTINAPEKVLPKPKPIKVDDKVVSTALPEVDLLAALQEEEKLNEMNRLIEKEQAAEQAEKTQEAIVDHTTQFQNLIQNAWRFPPSAKHNEVVLLRIFLVPTGEVADVQLLESSGNDALDRSAEQAVWKVAKFPVPTDIVIFEKNFRQLTLKLQPENARL